MSTIDKDAFCFGCGNGGHFLRDRHDYEFHILPNGFPWKYGHLDTGLLKNGKIPDSPDGRVFWTCGGSSNLWFAFYWWDRSGDSRPGSNSGFYVRGFELDKKNVQAAFDYACSIFPLIVERQHFPLILQNVDLLQTIASVIL